jgi:predicted amidophosphoribosyltransferase
MRLFTCRECGHRVRYGGETCGFCWKPTPILNRTWVLFAAIAAAVVAVVALVLP